MYEIYYVDAKGDTLIAATAKTKASAQKVCNSLNKISTTMYLVRQASSND